MKVDSHQKGIKGPISASMCWAASTDPDMKKCFSFGRRGSYLLLFLRSNFFFVLSFFVYFAHTTVSPSPRRILHIVKMKWM